MSGNEAGIAIAIRQINPDVICRHFRITPSTEIPQMVSASYVANGAGGYRVYPGGE